jgi:glycosyltransferase involved in cell wall biosynthesis
MYFYRHASRIQTVSRAVADAIRREIPAEAEKVRHIPNPIVGVESAGQDSAFEKRERVILFVGRVHPEKGLDHLVEAFRLVGDGAGWRLAIVGPWEEASGGGGEAYMRRLKDRCLASGMPVEWVGAVFDDHELGAWYRRAALFVYPTVAVEGEALPAAPLEAMAFGCPIVVSRLACFRDYLEEGRNGLSFDHNAAEPAAELARSLESALRSGDWLAKASREARLTASRFTVPKIASLYLEDFERLVPLL